VANVAYSRERSCMAIRN